MQDDFRGLKEDARALEAQLDESRGREAKALSEAHQAREEANAQRRTVPPPPSPPPLGPAHGGVQGCLTVCFGYMLTLFNSELHACLA